MRGPNLTNDQRHKIGCELLENSVKLKPKHGIMKKVATQYNIDRKTIFHIWRLTKEQRENGIPLCLDSNIKGKISREPIPFPLDEILSTKASERSTLDTIGRAVDVSKSTVHRWVKQKKLLSRTSSIKPYLTDENKYVRLNFVLSKLYFDRLINGLKFRSMDNDIHADEKWFYMSKPKSKYYSPPGEKRVYRSCKHKNHIEKIMFMAAVSRPLYAPNGDLIFDGKIGIFPFVTRVPAKNKSKNRPRGTMETKPIPNITRDVTRDMFVNHIIPTIKRKWPATSSKVINLQQDNCKAHITANDLEFIECATSDGLLQTIQLRKPAKNVDELIANVKEAWAQHSVESLDNVWLSLQACMVEVMKRMSHNDYKLPHLAKQARRRQGTLPRNLTVGDELVKECIEYLTMVGKTTNLDLLIEQLWYYDVRSNLLCKSFVK